MLAAMAAAAAKVDQDPLPCVPLLAHLAFKSPSELLPYLNTESKFRVDGGFVEGVYIRVDSQEWNEVRCKLVRSDFVAGITEHWLSFD
jgi:hypothetical protein